MDYEKASMRQLGSKILSLIFLISISITLIICMFSLFAPSYFTVFIETRVIALPLPTYLTDKLRENEQILTIAGYPEYASSFSALMRAYYCIFFLSFVPTLISGFLIVANKEVQVPKAKALIICLVFAAGGVWWIFLSGDFYQVRDVDFTGILRPPVGSFVAALVVAVLPIVITLFVVYCAVFLGFIGAAKSSNGNTFKD